LSYIPILFNSTKSGAIISSTKPKEVLKKKDLISVHNSCFIIYFLSLGPFHTFSLSSHCQPGASMWESFLSSPPFWNISAVSCQVFIPLKASRACRF